MQKLKDLLENIHKWAEKCENRECSSCEFPVIQ